MKAASHTATFYTAIIPLSTIAALCTLIADHLPAFPDSGHIFWLLGKLPSLLLPLVAFLGWRLNQTRILFVALLWLSGYLLIRFSTQYTLFGFTIPAMEAVSVAIPLGTTGILLIPESRLLSGMGALRLLAFLLPLTIAVVLGVAEGTMVHTALYWTPEAIGSWWFVPVAGVVLAMCSGVVLWRFADKGIHYFAVTTACAYLPLTLALNMGMGAHARDATTHATAVGMTTVSLLLGYALYRTYWESAYVDELTCVLNRRALNERMYRLGRHYSIAMIDIDYFKAFNDTYGHAQGDTVLKFVSSSLQEAFPNNVYRYGGEEFCVLFDGAPLRAAARRIEGVRQFVSARDFYIRMPDQARQNTSLTDRGTPVGSSIRVHISFSAGVAYRDVPDESPEDIVELADKALYGAKRNGRAKICCYAEA